MSPAPKPGGFLLASAVEGERLVAVYTIIYLVSHAATSSLCHEVAHVEESSGHLGRRLHASMQGASALNFSQNQIFFQ